ncbi:MAG TPA: cyclic nucleotide-binding domain-containing protein [Polyangiaceae bacterium]
MTREQVWETVSSFLAREFGRLLDVRDVRRIRRVAGEGWTVTVVLAASSGDLHVADVIVDESGAMTPVLDATSVIAAVKRAQTVSKMPPPAEDDMGDLGDFGATDDETDGLDALEIGEDPVEDRVEHALAKGDPASLREARDLLPRLLKDHEKRGATLLTMAEVEMKLAEPTLAKGYLEAAAREFGDRFDMSSLERSAAVALELLGKDAFVGSPVHLLLEQSRARLKPVSSLFECRSFAGMPADVRAAVEPSVVLRTLAPGEELVTEGQPSRNVFVVKSGLLGVWLEKPSGGQWLVRCCFPGWLLGESSVLVGDDPRCTATLRAERVSEAWTMPAAVVRTAMDRFPEFADRIAATKQLHRIDSFFSMHETMGQLDVQVRDEMLSCIQRLETFETETILLPANEVPSVACLVARGSIGLFEPGKTEPAATVGPDGFYGVRDSIHQIASGLEAVARADTTVAFFDAERLRKLCLASPAHVVAVLERLG